jgi:serine phosphatase RsbU (regulator of sigma subunit)
MVTMLKTWLAQCAGGIRAAMVAIAIGMAMSCIFAMGQGGFGIGLVLWGGIVGLTIYLAVELLQFLAAIVFGPTDSAWGNGIIFIAGGVLGWIVGMKLGSFFTHERLPFSALLGARLRALMVLTMAVALATGLILRSFSIMKRRLAQTIAAEKELELARDIQMRLLPPPLIARDGFTIAARNVPARFVAGDFYDVVDLDDGSTAIVVADVAGKGVGASLIMASVKAVLPFVARGTVAEAMRTLNEKLQRELGRREFVALAFARYEPRSGVMELANAGLPDPYRIGSSVEVLAVPGPRLPLGVRRDLAYETLRVTLGAGERVLFVSDGIPEGVHESRGYEQLAAMLQSMNGSAGRGEQWLDAFMGKVRAAAGDVLADDWTALIVERQASSPVG